MTRILIAGATGLVGSHVLSQALVDDRINAVVAPTRRPLPTHPKLHNPILDFTHLPEDGDWWTVDGVVCTMGTTRAKAGSDQAFRAVDLDLQLAVARHARAHGATRFALTSSMGADPRSRFLYLRTKGELEEAVAALDWPSLTIVRPGAILGDRFPPRNSEKFFASLLGLVAPILPKSFRGNPAEQIARTLLMAVIVGTESISILKADRLG